MTNELIKVEDGRLIASKEAVGIIEALKVIKIKEAELRQAIETAMVEAGIKKWDNDLFSVTVKEPTTRTAIDTKRLKEEQPSIYEEYSKISNVSGSIMIKYKEEKEGK